MATTTVTNGATVVHIPISEIKHEESDNPLQETPMNEHGTNVKVVIGRTGRHVYSQWVSLCHRYLPLPPISKFHAVASSSSSIQKPVAIDEFMTDDEYEDFCRTVNRYIHQYDVLLHRRARMGYYTHLTLLLLQSVFYGALLFWKD